MSCFPSDLFFAEKMQAVCFTRPIVGDNNPGAIFLISFYEERKRFEEQTKAFFQMSPDLKSSSTSTASNLKKTQAKYEGDKSCNSNKNRPFLKLVLSSFSGSNENLEECVKRLKPPGNSAKHAPLQEAIVALGALKSCLELLINNFGHKYSSEECHLSIPRKLAQHLEVGKNVTKRSLGK